MKIAIDISQIVYGTGVSVYTKNLVKNLLKIDSENNYFLFGGSLRRGFDLRSFLAGLQGSSFEGKVYPVPPVLADFVWNKLHIAPIEWFTGKVDVFHSSDWTQPPSSAFNVTTVHDLSSIISPAFSKKDWIRDVSKTHSRRLELVKKEVDRIIVPSNATKKDLIDLDFNPERIRVIPEAVEDEFKKSSEVEVFEVKKKYNLIRPYLLTIGVGGRKNTERLIRAFEDVRSKSKLDLVLVGTANYQASVRGVNTIGHITNPDLSALYSGAEVLVYPSLYEGFGLPILQAFATGCPVVTSNVSSMPEVAGDAAVLVDPYSVESIAEGVKSALRRKETLIKLGLERIKEFSWEKTAKQTLRVYEESARTSS